MSARSLEMRNKQIHLLLLLLYECEQNILKSLTDQFHFKKKIKYENSTHISIYVYYKLFTSIRVSTIDSIKKTI